MKPWQIANLLNVVRQPFDALELLQETIKTNLEPEDYTQTCASLGKTLINLTYYQEAQKWAYQAYQNDKNSDCIQVIVADALLLSGEDESAVEIYRSLMNRSTLFETHSTEEVFRDLFSRETGVVPSPVWAVEFAKSLQDPQQAAHFWQLGEVEYYDSPYFRTHHAYYLEDIGETQRSFAKLIALVREMPWLKEASLNLLTYFQHFDPSGKKIMPDFQAQLRQQIKDNNWTTEGMEEIEVGK